MSTDSTHRRAPDAADRAGVRDSARTLEQAAVWHQSGESRRAIVLLQQLLERDPSSVRAYEALADVLMDEGRYGEALACWERLLEIEPGHERGLAGVDRALEARARRYGARPAWHATPRPDGSWPGTAPRSLMQSPAQPSAATQAEAEPAEEAERAASTAAPPSSALRTVAVADLLMGLLEYADPYFRGNASQTRLIAAAVARRMGLDDAAVQEIELAALLRDIGQLPMKGMISEVGSQLHADAKRYVERHVETAMALLDGVDVPDRVRLAVRHHHERWDGSGYPDRLEGTAIPLEARILAAADTFAAMIAARPHRLPQSVDSALSDLRDWAGSRYDPAVIDALVSVIATTSWRGPGFGLRQHVVVVDADETRAIVSATRLCSRGYLAEAAFSAAGAGARMTRSRVSPVAALLVSAELPDADVIGLLRRTRHASATAFTPVIILHAPRAARLSLMEAGADLCLDADAGTDEIAAALASLLRRERATVVAARVSASDRRAAGLHGDLEDFPVSWLLQVLHYDGRTAAVFVTAPDDEGTIYLDRGNPRLAQTRELAGEAAFRAMLRWRKGTFVVDPDAETDRRTISRPLMNLLLEEAVVDDHSSFLASQDGSGRDRR